MYSLFKLFNLKRFLIAIAIIAFDLAVYLFLGLYLMGYEDFYDAGKGAYWSLESMTPMQQVAYISYNAWIVVNILAVVFLGYKFLSIIKRNFSKSNPDINHMK